MRIIWWVLYFIVAIPAFAQVSDAEYLKLHVKPLQISPRNQSDSFDMLNEIAGDYKFFFTAEEHWQSMNTQIQLGFLVNLHQNGKVRNLIVEAGYSYSHMINRYLETGDETFLIKAIYAIPVCTDDFMNFYRDLYAYNQFLPTKDRIKVIGIDLERSPLLALECLSYMLPKKILTAGVREKINRLKALAKEKAYNDKEVKKFFRHFHKEMKERERAYKRYWGDNFWLFEMILESTIQGFDSPISRELVYPRGSDRKREERMYQNFKLLVKGKKIKPGNFFAQFGGIHTELNPSINWGYATLAQQLNYDAYSPVKGKVLTISKFFRRTKQIYEKFKDFDQFTSIMRQIENSSNSDIVLCRIIGNEERFPEISENFQFIMVIKEELEKKGCK